MNLFILDSDPYKAATRLIAANRYGNPMHIPKMAVEAAQMLSTSIRLQLGSPGHLFVRNYKAKVNEDPYKLKVNYQYVLPKEGMQIAFINLVSHPHHPCTKWVCESFENWMWAFYHAKAILDINGDDGYRTYSILAKCLEYVDRITFEHTELTPFVQCVPEQYQIPDKPIEAYNNFYTLDKCSVNGTVKLDVDETDTYGFKHWYEQYSGSRYMYTNKR